MSIPEAVKKQVEDATKLAEEISKNLQQAGEDGQTTEGEQTAQEQIEEQEQVLQQSEETQWEHKYKVLQGKYNKEVPRLHEELRQKSSEIEYLRGKLELLEKMISQQGQVKQEEVKDDTIEKFREDFPDIYSAVNKLLENYISSQLNKLIEDKIKPVENVTRQVAETTFYSSLARLVPDWEKLNKDADFVAWLKEKDRFAGVTRHELMLSAFNRGDVETVAQFFNAYKEEQNINNNQPKRNVVPPEGKSQTYSYQGGGGKTYTQREIEEFYRKSAMGKIPKSERDKIERDIIKAMRDGRVIFGR